eukprot:Nitzschia sp. Nitz4//scaffold127_size64804//61735//62757//NITZ4_006190-RA/size64804-processed-gene-0.33-mRNA-1//-1//CDS//3329534792//112//frame0
MFLFQSKKTQSQLQTELQAKLGDGPMRFGPVCQGSALASDAEASGLSDDEIFQFATIKMAWSAEGGGRKKKYSSANIFRVAKYCNYDEEKSMRLLSKSKPEYFNLSTFDLQEELLSRTVFPCPGLKTREGHNVFYMRASRFFPLTMSAEKAINTLIFVMNHILCRDSTSGLGFILNMDGWGSHNYNDEFYRQILQVIQGKVFPAEVSSFLVVNAPASFEVVWRSMKSYMTPEFQKMSQAISDDELAYFMELDFEQSMPDEIPGGRVDSEHLATDFLAFCEAEELAVTPKSKGKGRKRRTRANGDTYSVSGSECSSSQGLSLSHHGSQHGSERGLANEIPA